MQLTYLGNIYTPPFDRSWKDNSALTPTPFLLNDSTIRIFCSFRDLEGIGRIGYVDVSSNDPREILSVSKNPVLDLGLPGYFDDNGLILGDIIRYKSEVRLYYVGFQIPRKCKFLAFSGLALSHDNGDNFIKRSTVPIVDRMTGCETINAIHTVLYDNNKFRVWCGSGNSWVIHNGVQYPSYQVSYLESRDGVDFSGQLSSIHIPLQPNEYRLGRPRVYKLDNKYLMLFTYAKIGESYQVGSAWSSDGFSWLRDSSPALKLDKDAIADCGVLSYPTYLKTKTNEYIFFNGSNMGQNGIYCARVC